VSEEFVTKQINTFVLDESGPQEIPLIGHEWHAQRS
jgi:hypothetical protein